MVGKEYKILDSLYKYFIEYLHLFANVCRNRNDKGK